jgi:hypothetical protein
VAKEATVVKHLPGRIDNFMKNLFTASTHIPTIWLYSYFLTLYQLLIMQHWMRFDGIIVKDE